VDRGWRVPGVEWWPDEAITDEHVSLALAGGLADVMLTHESPARTPVRAVQDVLRVNPLGLPTQPRLESAASRARVAQVWHAVAPAVLLHGHMHTPGDGVTADGRRVISLGRDCQEGHVAFLDLPTLQVDTPSLEQLREASRNG